uniref:hypothetical protein n=1 Tax=Clostridium sp. NkU-1 TaxID=1095009 RepID=UPI000A896CBE
MFTRKDLMKLLAPLIVEQILIVLVGMVNVVMAAAVGEASVSGVSLVESINILIIQMLSALATGGAVISAVSWEKAVRECLQGSRTAHWSHHRTFGSYYPYCTGRQRKPVKGYFRQCG